MINTTLCYIEKDGKYLCLHRTKKQNDLNEDKWIGIGGKFEDKESPEDCVKREVKEETGLTLTRFAYRGIITFVSDKWQTEYMHLFHADGFTGMLLPCCDEGELAWISPEELLQKNIWQGDRIFLRLMQNTEKFFSLKLCYQGNTLYSAELDGQPLAIDKE